MFNVVSQASSSCEGPTVCLHCRIYRSFDRSVGLREGYCSKMKLGKGEPAYCIEECKTGTGGKRAGWVLSCALVVAG